MKCLARAIRDLTRRFGPQGWWPRVVKQMTRVGGQRKGNRNTNATFAVQHHICDQNTWIAQTIRDHVFEVAIGAILTQNTAWSNVEHALVCLAERKLLTSRAVARCRLRTLERCIRSSGYFHQKAKKFKGFAKFVESDLRGDLRHLLDHDDPRAELLAQWGIGHETADTILLYGLHQPVFVVDTYTRRFLAEITRDRRWLAAPYEDVRIYCERELPRSITAWQEAHALIVAWGKRRGRAA